MMKALGQPWWPHVQLRTAAYWRGRAWLFRVVAEATLEFADRLEVYELDDAEFERLQQLSYHDRIAALLNRRPDRIERKLPSLSPPAPAGDPSPSP
ncbi:MAG: hypothetical protein RMM58_03225 [Chloroflexota bacterium]|nr:hypothetical protein [Chloroflexota bacterium]